MQHHGAGLRRILHSKKIEAGRIDALVEALMADWQKAELEAADRAMLAYAVKLTRTPWAIDAADAATLREVGFDDRGIHDICAIVGYFAFVNRIADGLGVELESS